MSIIIEGVLPEGSSAITRALKCKTLGLITCCLLYICKTIIILLMFPTIGMQKACARG